MRLKKFINCLKINRHEVLLFLVENSVPIRRKKIKNALLNKNGKLVWKNDSKYRIKWNQIQVKAKNKLN